MSELFLKIVNMSISAGWLVLVIVVLRILLKKAPKWIFVLLWGMVALRLVCPFTFESMLSLIPSAQTVSPEIMLDPSPEISTGIQAFNDAVNPIISQSFAPQPAASANPLQIWIPVLVNIWLLGIAAMLVYALVSYLRLRRLVGTAVKYRDNIFRSENVSMPFVLGVVKPRIYLPFKMGMEDLEMVVSHEQAHIRRKDHWWKPLGFLLLALHWFNPLMWLAYILLCRDIEFACDEKVIKELDNVQKADYTQALLACSIGRKQIAPCPLAFGEVGVKERVRSVMNYKKPAFWIIVAALIACTVVAVCFLTDPVKGGVEYDPVTDAEDVVATISAGDNVTRVSTQNGDVVILNNSGNPWHFDKGQEVPVDIVFQNDGSSKSMKAVGYIYCGEGTKGLYAKEIFSNQTVYSTGGSFTAPESGNYLFYFKNFSASWIMLESFIVGHTFEATLIEIHENYYLVEPSVDSTEYKCADRIEIPIRHFPASPEPQVGDTLIITYNGIMQETYPAQIGQIYNARVRQEIPHLSLNDVIILSQKGYDLSWSDFDNFQYYETGSGLYIRVYEINSRFSLGIGGAGSDSEPMYIYLSVSDDADARIDIRDGGVTDFISRYNVDPREESVELWDRIPMVMVDGQLYLTTGYESTLEGRCGVMDGEITSQVSGSEVPTQNDQSNFGTGYPYQYGATEGTVENYMGGKWWIYATEEVRTQLQDPDLQPNYTPKGVSGENVTELNTEPDVVWSDGLVFEELAPGEEMVSEFEIVLEEDSAVLLSIGWARTGLVMEYGICAEDGTNYFQEKAGGHSRLLIEDIPAGKYRLYAKNSDAYNGLPAYENPEESGVSFNATGVMLYSLQNDDWSPEDPPKKFYLTIGDEEVMRIEVSMPDSSGGVQNADGTAFKKGERIWLEMLDGYSDLRGLTITAYDAEDSILWTASVPNTQGNEGFTHLTNNGWTITNVK